MNGFIHNFDMFYSVIITNLINKRLMYDVRLELLTQMTKNIGQLCLEIYFSAANNKQMIHE